MQTKLDHSYGVVPVIKEGGEWKVLLVYQISYRGDSFWTLPKGHPEKGETPTQAAERELQEETGIMGVDIDTKYKFVMRYDFYHEGTKIDKTVVYFLGRLKDSNVSIVNPEEIKALRLATFDEAKVAVAHQETKRILQEAQKVLTKTTGRAR